MLLLAGFLIGLALVAPVGPVTLTIFGIGVEQGRRPALIGAGAVVAVDALFVPVALVGATQFAALDPGLVHRVEAILGIALAGIAGAMVIGADRARELLASIERPGRTLGAIAAVNPAALASWFGLALALPASVHGVTGLTAFGAGLLAASALWHAALAMGSSWIGSRLTETARTGATRLSAAVLFVVAAVLVL